MPLINANRVRETTTTTGTGTLSLGGATSGRRTFVAGVGDGAECVYLIEASDSSWEVSRGTVTDGAPDTLTRTLIESSTGSLLNLPAGTHHVMQVVSAHGLLEQTVNRIEGNETNLGNLGSGVTLSLSDGNNQRGTVDTASVTLTVPAAPATAQRIRLRLTNSVGSVAITIAGAAWLGWMAGSAPTLHADSGKENLLTFDGNTTGWTADGAQIGT